MSENEIEDTVIKTLQGLINTWGVSVEVEFSDNRSMCYEQKRHGKYYLNFGTPVLRHIMEYGIKDRCCKNLRGLNALKGIACHEYAHAVQESLGFVARGSIHNADFYNIYWEMLQAYFPPKKIRSLK